MSKAQLKILFLKIGGHERLKEILRDFYQRMSQDILIGFFFSGKDIHAIADQQQQFLLYAMGIHESYQGKSPSSAHSELPRIFSGHFDRRLVLLETTLRAHGLSETDIKIWVNFENAFREIIVKDEHGLK